MALEEVSLSYFDVVAQGATRDACARQARQRKYFREARRSRHEAACVQENPTGLRFPQMVHML
jgi:hypothetical protein